MTVRSTVVLDTLEVHIMHNFSTSFAPSIEGIGNNGTSGTVPDRGRPWRLVGFHIHPWLPFWTGSSNEPLLIVIIIGRSDPDLRKSS